MTTPRKDVLVEKLRLALELYEAGESMMRQTLRRKHPEATEAEIERLILEWLRDRPGARLGDIDESVARLRTLDETEP